MRKKFLTLGVSLLILGLAACKPATPSPTPTTAPSVLKTAAAQTASAFLTATAQAVPTQTATVTPNLQQTTAAQTQAAMQTQAAAATATPTIAVSPTIDSNLVERVTFVKDVTVPDGTNYTPGGAFTKTWRLQNNGTSTWNSAYSLVFISGEKMSGPDRVSLTSTVAPGTQVDVSVKLTAPAQPGHYRGFWKMMNSAGKFIDDAVYVDINVTSGNTSTPGTTATPTATLSAAATATSGPVTISALSMAVDPIDFTGACPKTFTYTGKFTLSAAATVTFKLEAGSSTPGFTFNLPAAQTKPFPAGEQTVTFSLELTQSVTGWAQLHITAPADVASNQANFTLTCQP